MGHFLILYPAKDFTRLRPPLAQSHLLLLAIKKA